MHVVHLNFVEVYVLESKVPFIHCVISLTNTKKKGGASILLIDASNAFNCINRYAALWNSRILWPSCSLFMFNTYRGWAPLTIMDSSELLYSREGVTQGDPLSMFIYAVATIPLITQLGKPMTGSHVCG